MITLFSMVVSVAVAVLIVCGGILMKKYGKDLSIPLRAVGLALAAVMFARFLFDQPPIYYLEGLDSPLSPFASPFITALMLILVWFAYAAMLITVLNQFFKYRTLSNLTTCFALPVFILTVVFSGAYMTALLGEELAVASEWRVWTIAVEGGLGIGLGIVNLLEMLKAEDGRVYIGESAPYPKGRAELLSFLVSIPLILVAIMPGYTLQAFLGNIGYNIRFYDLTEAHRLMIYAAVALPVVAYHFLKDKTDDVKYFICLFMSLAFLWSYIGRWNVEMLKDPFDWPLHLCNTAMFLVPICLIFRFKKLFNFCLFINVVGAFLAMVLPSEYADLTAIGTERASFWLNHWAAFGMPLLIIALNIFPRPKFREWVYAVIELSVYYFAMLFTNSYLTAKYGRESDFFFTNGDFIVSSLGKWAEDIYKISTVVEIGGVEMTFYPLYQVLFLLVYIAFTVAIWFIYELLFRAIDAGVDRRLRQKDFNDMKKKLTEYLGGRSIHEPATGDKTPRLVLRHFSKRYGSNKHYSVNDVSFEVKPGEIFGFLGPNGAGKSTIIKSMVGIQTITSGEIEICGYNVEMQPVQAKQYSGFVPDHYALYENLTGREYVNYIADLFQVPASCRDRIVEKYVERFQLTGSFDNQMKTYSHGMKQKITIMSALVHDPKVWILDEPLTGLDPTSIFEVKECMKEHAAAGNIVFFSSHIIDVVEKICDRIAIIKKGKLRAVTSIKELEEKGISLEKFYLDIINDGDDEHVPFIEEAVGDAEAKTV